MSLFNHICKVIMSRSPTLGIRTWTSLGPLFCIPHIASPKPKSQEVVTLGLWREARFTQVGTRSENFITLLGFPEVTISLVLEIWSLVKTEDM